MQPDSPENKLTSRSVISHCQKVIDGQADWHDNLARNVTHGNTNHVTCDVSNDESLITGQAILAEERERERQGRRRSRREE